MSTEDPDEEISGVLMNRTEGANRGEFVLTKLNGLYVRSQTHTSDIRYFVTTAVDKVIYIVKLFRIVRFHGGECPAEDSAEIAAGLDHTSRGRRD